MMLGLLFTHDSACVIFIIPLTLGKQGLCVGERCCDPQSILETEICRITHRVGGLYEGLTSRRRS